MVEKQKMKFLLIFSHRNALIPTTGDTVRSWNLINYLIKNKIDVSIIHSIDSIGLEDKKLYNKCKIHYVKKLEIFGLREKFFDDINPFLIYKLYKVLKKEKFDIIQLEYPFGFFILKLLIRNKAFIIFDSLGIESEFVKVSVNEQRFPKILYPIVRRFTHFYEKMVCKLTNAIINISENDRIYYIKNYNIHEDKSIVIQIPSTINSKRDIIRTNNSKNDCRKILNLPLDKVIAIFHGSIPHPPNEEAFRLIKNYIAPKFENSDLIFVLAGKNVEKCYKRNIICLGFVNNLKYLLDAADFAIVPIISGEGLRVKVSDYISCALPFVSTEKGIQGINFLIEDEDYFLCDKVNIDFIEKIKILKENNEIRKKFHNNLLKKSNFLNSKRIENQFINFYRTILKIRNKSQKI